MSKVSENNPLTEKILEPGNNYSTRMEEYGLKFVHEPTGKQIQILSEKGNMSKEAAVILESMYGISTEYSYPELLEPKNQLEEKGIIEKNNGEYHSKISLPDLEQLKDLDEGVIKGNSNPLNDEDEEMQKEVAYALEILDKDSVRTCDVAPITDLSSRQISRVFEKWEDRYEADPEEFRRNGRVTRWNIELIKDEVRSEFLED